ILAQSEVVLHSSSIRAGRSVRLQMIALSSVTSPLATPDGVAGRPAARRTNAGARPALHASARRPPHRLATAPSPTAAGTARKVRRESDDPGSRAVFPLTARWLRSPCGLSSIGILLCALAADRARGVGAPHGGQTALLLQPHAAAPELSRR